MNYKNHENLPVRKATTKSTPYTNQYESWLAAEKKKGLLYVNIFYGDGLDKDTVNYESFCEEFMRMRNASTISDPEVLGRYSI